MKTIILNPLAFLSKGRNAKYDLLKLIAMLMVVFDHCVQRWVAGVQESQLYNYIFITQMPLFMFISGVFLFYKKNINDSKTLVRAIFKNLISLLLPFLTYSIVNTLITGAFGRNIFVGIFNSILNPMLSLWFLWVLFWIDSFAVVSFFLANKIKKMPILFSTFFYFIFLAVVLVIFKLSSGLFYTKYILYYSIFIIVGFSFSLFKQTTFYVKLNVPLLNIVIPFFCFFALLVCMLARPRMIFMADTIMNIIIRVVAGISSIFLLLFIGKFTTRFRFFVFASRFGKLSLEFYYIHLLVLLIPFLNNGVDVDSVNGVLKVLGMFLFVICLTFILILILKTNVFTDLFFFGKTHRIRNSITTTNDNNYSKVNL